MCGVGLMADGRLIPSTRPRVSARLYHDELMRLAGARQPFGQGSQILPAAGGKLVQEPAVDGDAHSK